MSNELRAKRMQDVPLDLGRCSVLDTWWGEGGFAFVTIRTGQTSMGAPLTLEIERRLNRAASPLPHGGSEWRPIEDALKDGRLYLLYCRVNGTTVGSWSESSQKWLRDSEDYWPVDPSHFQEMPPAPAAYPQQDGGE